MAYSTMGDLEAAALSRLAGQGDVALHGVNQMLTDGQAEILATAEVVVETEVAARLSSG